MGGGSAVEAFWGGRGKRRAEDIRMYKTTCSGVFSFGAKESVDAMLVVRLRRGVSREGDLREEDDADAGERVRDIKREERARKGQGGKGIG